MRALYLAPFRRNGRERETGREQRRAGVEQRRAVWIIADLFLRICERFGDLASQGALVKGVDKVCDLDLRELFVEGKERVHVDLQKPCQRRQECDVWK